MKLTDLGPEILLLHLAPLLSKRDILLLTTVNTVLFRQFENVRFAEMTVRSYRHRASVLSVLRPRTLRLIKDLYLNGTRTDLNNIGNSNDLTGVTKLTIVGTVMPAQQCAISRVARQLTEFTDNKEFGDGHRNSSTSSLSPGSFQNLQMMRLKNVLLPPIKILMANSQGIASFLRTITFLPYQFEGPLHGNRPTPDTYVSDTLTLLQILSDREFVPSLRLVQVALQRGVGSDSMRLERISVLEGILASAATHGLWRLFADKTLRPGLRYRIGNWSCWCDNKRGDIFVTTEEVARFTIWCENNGHYPRWDDFVSVNVHLSVESTGSGVNKLDIAVLAQIRGVSVLPGKKLNLHDALGAVSKGTRCVVIQLQIMWGTVEGSQLDPARFQMVESLSILQASLEINNGGNATPGGYWTNISLTAINYLSLPAWCNLRELTVPALALQRGYVDRHPDQSPTVASCGKHIPGYSFDWLAACTALQSLQIIDWDACATCYEKHQDLEIDIDDDISGWGLIGGLRKNFPAGITTFLITGMFWAMFLQMGDGNLA